MILPGPRRMASVQIGTRKSPKLPRAVFTLRTVFRRCLCCSVSGTSTHQFSQRRHVGQSSVAARNSKRDREAGTAATKSPKKLVEKTVTPNVTAVADSYLSATSSSAISFESGARTATQLRCIFSQPCSLHFYCSLSLTLSLSLRVFHSLTLSRTLSLSLSLIVRFRQSAKIWACSAGLRLAGPRSFTLQQGLEHPPPASAVAPWPQPENDRTELTAPN